MPPRILFIVGLHWLFATFSAVQAADPAESRFVIRPNLFKQLTEPPCSYCSTQHRKGFIQDDDRVLTWLRAAHNGGAIPLRHFLAGPRIINDTYGLFFFDPDGGYVAAYQKDYGYEFHGWRNGVMIVKGKDGTLWSALTGIAFDGPQKGKRLTRIPNTLMTWRHWLMLHPESTAYDLYDGKKYSVTALPTEMSAEARESLFPKERQDRRLAAMAEVLGIEVGDARIAFPLDTQRERACYITHVGDTPLAVFWYGPTKSAVAFEATVNGRPLTFFADDISPDTAPFKDKETGTRWTLAGRAVDGPLRGQELQWVNSIHCRWYAWSAENPTTKIFNK